ncbi:MULTISPECIES: hypothetical protein [unclassified Campylobacter]|uniref:hypothetical protein n=1 Tax=unclassified Campylobacter TaxID=2593542 RepID=UPI001D319540|nr:hypothetical protein [Campylobacter sp. RM12651]MBZ7983887.1 hypothetical protein [Campylobacter sp. RM12647]ULO04383.1 hypothetical protein AVBRAN_1948 [Campylobacter sp. RM12651]
MATIIIENTNISNEVYSALETFIKNLDKSANIKRINLLDEAISGEFYKASDILKELENE